jgi:integrase
MAQIIKRGNHYIFRVSTYDANKKQIKRNFPWDPPEGMSVKEIERELPILEKKYENLVKTGNEIDCTATFADFAEYWIANHAEKNLTQKTVYEYKKLLIRINKAIGASKLNNLKPVHLGIFYKNLGEEGVREDSKYKITKNFGEILKAAGLNASQLARLAELGNSTVQSAVNNRLINETSAVAISKALKQNFDELFEPANKSSVLSGNTILHYHRLISSMLNFAVEEQILESNPAARVRAPKPKYSEAKYLDEEQAKSALLKLHNEAQEFSTIINILLDSGVRRGELCAIKWSDIEFNKKTLHIRRAMMYIPKMGVFETETKTKATRDIKLAKSTIDKLLEHKAAQNIKAEKCGDQWHNNDYVFTRWNGEPLRPDSITKSIRKFAERNNLPRMSTHTLRHTNASLLIAAGTNLTTVSNRLGHSHITTTMKHYAHAIKSANEAAAEVMDGIFQRNNQVIASSHFRVRNKALKGYYSTTRHKQGTNPNL